MTKASCKKLSFEEKLGKKWERWHQEGIIGWFRANSPPGYPAQCWLLHQNYSVWMSITKNAHPAVKYFPVNNSLWRLPLDEDIYSNLWNNCLISLVFLNMPEFQGQWISIQTLPLLLLQYPDFNKPSSSTLKEWDGTQQSSVGFWCLNGHWENTFEGSWGSYVAWRPLL